MRERERRREQKSERGNKKAKEMRPKSKSSLVIKYQIKNRTHSRFLHLCYSFLSILLLTLLFFLLLNSRSFFHSPNSTQRDPFSFNSPSTSFPPSIASISSFPPISLSLSLSLLPFSLHFYRICFDTSGILMKRE